jgi:hypothetical protein
MLKSLRIQMSADILIDNKIGMDYETYLTLFKKLVDEPNFDNELDMKWYEFRKLNLQRTLRLQKYFIPSDDLINVISSTQYSQTWLVLTESWCGDSAQNLPIIAKAASLNTKINLRIVPRDENLELMDKYLTNGSRSIPKLIVFDNKNNELFKWGPRPAEAQNLFSKLKNEGLDKSEINKQLHLWYGKNHGKEVEKELIVLLKKVNVNLN